MDIKDFILISGGVLIAMVVGHGFWIAYRAKREPLRLDIVPDLIHTNVDEMERLRGELPNGGSRIVSNRLSPEQESFELEAPVLMDPAEEVPPTHRPSTAGAQQAPARRPRVAVDHDDTIDIEPTLRQELASSDERSATSAGRESRKRHLVEPSLRPQVREVVIPTTEPANSSINDDVHDALANVTDERISRNAVDKDEEQAEMMLDVPGLSLPGRARNATGEQPAERERAERPERNETRYARSEVRNKNKRADRSAGAPASPEAPRADDAPALNPAVEELLIINVVALKGSTFDGEGIVAALRAEGLRYGDMNVFHRVEPTTKAKMYSVANVVEPGTFDLSDLSNMSSPGMSFFLQLPGPENPMLAFTDMLESARHVAMSLGGEIKDEQLNRLTGQTAEHMRQRISDYTRRRLSKRA